MAMSNHELNENWSVSFKIVVPIFAALFTATVWLTTVIWRMENRQAISWTYHDMRSWTKDMQIHNTNMTWTDPSDVFWSNRQGRTSESVPIVGMRQ